MGYCLDIYLKLEFFALRFFTKIKKEIISVAQTNILFDNKKVPGITRKCQIEILNYSVISNH